MAFMLSFHRRLIEKTSSTFMKDFLVMIKNKVWRWNGAGDSYFLVILEVIFTSLKTKL